MNRSFYLKWAICVTATFSCFVYGVEKPSPTSQSKEKLVCRIGFGRIGNEGKALHGERLQEISSVHYKGDVPPIPKAFSKSSFGRTSIFMGKAEEIPANHQVVSYGFRICNVVMFRNNKSGRLVVYHYWEGEDVNFWKLDQIRESFDPESLEVVLFGNEGSSSLRIMEEHLKRRVDKFKSYIIHEKGRWEFVYDQGTDHILYHGTDSKNIAVVRDIFGKEAAAFSGQRFPEHDVELRIREAQENADRVGRKISYLINDLAVPSDLEDLPQSEKELRLLWLEKTKVLLSLPLKARKQKDQAEDVLKWQRKLLLDKFGITSK